MEGGISNWKKQHFLTMVVVIADLRHSWAVLVCVAALQEPRIFLDQGKS